jgi:serine/threonine protein kinase
MDLIGRIINGRYKLIDERGSGNFGEVYIARDLLTNYIYAAKVMYLDQTQDEELLTRFKREAYILQRLNDPHIVRLVDYGNDNTIYFILMHHVDGQNLKWFIQNYGPMELPRALNYTLQIAEGLEAAYRQGIVHRDMKPQNILISNKGLVKIADFGLSRSMDSPTITTSDKFMGTAYYSAPEQVQSGHTADTRADLYSLAVILFESLAGHPPYLGDSVVDIVFKHMNDPIPSIRRERSDVPPELETFFRRALAKSPVERYQTPREFINALEEIQRIVRGPTVPISASQPLSPSSPRPSAQSSTPPPTDMRPTLLPAQLIVTTTGQTFVLNKEEMIIGREDPKREIRPDIQINDQTMTVGRKHARLVRQQGTWKLIDENSRNKTRVNSKILAPYEAEPLSNGDLLHFGRIEARFESDQRPPNP